MKIELNKKYRTRDGVEARILAVDLPGAYPVAAAIIEPNSPIVLESYTSEGRAYEDGKTSHNDLAEYTEMVSYLIVNSSGGVAFRPEMPSASSVQPGFGIIKYTIINDKLTAVEIVQPQA